MATRRKGHQIQVLLVDKDSRVKPGTPDTPAVDGQDEKGEE